MKQKYILSKGTIVKLWLKHVKEKLKLSFATDIGLNLYE